MLRIEHSHGLLAPCLESSLGTCILIFDTGISLPGIYPKELIGQCIYQNIQCIYNGVRCSIIFNRDQGTLKINYDISIQYNSLQAVKMIALIYILENGALTECPFS